MSIYPEFHVKVAVLGWHLTRNHPLPDGNRRAGFLAKIEFAERNGFEWIPAERDEATGGDETVEVIESIASGGVSVEDLAAWIEMRLHKSSSS